MAIKNKRATPFSALALFCTIITGPLLITLPNHGAMAQTEAESIDKVIAIVDDDVILASELELRTSQIMVQISESDLANIDMGTLSGQILDQLILEHLQMQMAVRNGIRVNDNVLNQALTTIAQQNNMTFNQFREALEVQDVYFETREQVRKDIILNELQSAAVNQRIDITRQEVENYLRSESGIAAIAPEYRAAHILVPVSAPNLSSREEELAGLLYQRLLEDDSNILQIAGAGEISRIPVSGGDLGWNKAENLPSLFQEIVPELEPGEVSEPFESPAGFHIVQLLQVRGETTLRVDQSHVRHILIAPNEIRTDAQAETLIHELHQRVLDGEDFADIARQNTDDMTSMVAGGDLDWVGEGQLPNDFLAVIDATEIGGTSEPFLSTTGWHIVEVLARRTEDMTEENRRFIANQTLRERKFENELQNWLTEIRDMSYIQFKDE